MNIMPHTDSVILKFTSLCKEVRKLYILAFQILKCKWIACKYWENFICVNYRSDCFLKCVMAVCCSLGNNKIFHLATRRKGDHLKNKPPQF